MSDLQASLNEYNNQLALVNEALLASPDDGSRESLATLKSDLEQLILLTQESLNVQSSTAPDNGFDNDTNTVDSQKEELDDEYALFMQEMAKTGAYETADKDQPSCSKEPDKQDHDHTSDIEEELSTLLGMKCAVYHTHKWGGQPSLHNAMVSAVVPRQDDDQFQDLQVRVLFTHPTHAEMLPCPFYLDGECKFDDEKCRYSHGDVVALSNLREAIEPDFDGIKVGSRILMKLKPPDDEDITVTKRSTEKYSLWHRAIVKSVDLDKRTCIAKIEQGAKTGEKRKSGSDEVFVRFEEIFPLNVENESSSDSDDSLSDTEYPDSKCLRSDSAAGAKRDLLIEKSLQNNAPPIGGWEKHTRGIGSKLMLAMGYVPGTGLGATGDGRLQPVEARVLPVGKSLDKCMEISEKYASRDPLKLESKLKRLQNKEEERNKRAYDREKDKERRNVFNFLNRTIGNQSENDAQPNSVHSVAIKQSTSKDLNIEQFKITEDTKKLEREIVKLNNSLARNPSGSPGHRALASQLQERSKELSSLKNRELQISKEQRHRKDKQKMTIF